MPTPNIDVVKTALTKDGRDLKIRSAIEQAWVDVQKNIQTALGGVAPRLCARLCGNTQLIK
jgi:hypothetical protein